MIQVPAEDGGDGDGTVVGEHPCDRDKSPRVQHSHSARRPALGPVQLHREELRKKQHDAQTPNCLGKRLCGMGRAK